MRGSQWRMLRLGCKAEFFSVSCSTYSSTDIWHGLIKVLPSFKLFADIVNKSSFYQEVTSQPTKRSEKIRFYVYLCIYIHTCVINYIHTSHLLLTKYRPSPPNSETLHFDRLKLAVLLILTMKQPDWRRKRAKGRIWRNSSPFYVCNSCFTVSL